METKFKDLGMEIDKERFMKNRKTIVFLVLFMELFCNGTGQGEKMNSDTKVKEESSIEMKKELQTPLEYEIYSINNTYGIYHIPEAEKSNGSSYYLLHNDKEETIQFAIPFIKERPRYSYKKHSKGYFYFQLSTGDYFRFQIQLVDSLTTDDKIKEFVFDISKTKDGFNISAKNLKRCYYPAVNDVDFLIKEAELEAEGYYDYPYDHLEDLPESE
jgi:hypothetical protein